MSDGCFGFDPLLYQFNTCADNWEIYLVSLLNAAENSVMLSFLFYFNVGFY